MRHTAKSFRIGYSNGILNKGRYEMSIGFRPDWIDGPPEHRGECEDAIADGDADECICDRLDTIVAEREVFDENV